MRFSAQESSCRGTQFLAFRSAVLTHWGEFGWSEVRARLSADARATLIDAPVAPVAWIPERHMMELSEAVFDGPVGGSEEVYRSFIDTMIGHGFGRIRRFLIQFAPPEALLARAPDLWQHDHTQGELLVEMQDLSARVELRDHIHASTPLSRLTCAEAFRRALSRTRARDVTVEHRPLEGALEVWLRWS
jgi:hypothetical protein